MPLAIEVPPSTDPPTSAAVTAMVATMRSWRWVTPEQRSQLRAAVSMLPIIEASPRPKDPPIDRGMRVREVAGLLGVSTRTVHKLIHEGTLPGYRLSSNPGSEFRVPESEVRRFLESRLGAGAAS